MNDTKVYLNGWTETLLGNVADIVKDSWKVGSEFSNYIGLEHINEGTLTINGIGNSSKLASNKYKFKKGDILFGKLRPYFRKVVVPDFDGVCSTDIWVIRAKENYDQKFLFYFMANPILIDKSMGASTGTHMPRADWRFLEKTIWDIPKLPEQQSIASILSSFDDKIELLRNQNQTLEEMAQTLFKEWFVNFRFPGVGNMIDSELGMIPEGWKIDNIGKYVNLKGGATPSTKNPDYWDGNINWTSPKDLSNNKQSYLLDTQKMITGAGLKKISSGLMPKGTLLFSSRAPIGYIALSNVDIAINQGYIAFLPGAVFSNYFMYNWLKLNMKSIIGAANGSTFLEISKSAFRQLQTPIPDQSTLKSFDQLITPIFKKLLNNIVQIQTLSKLRDKLLPKLMSGEIQVKD